MAGHELPPTHVLGRELITKGRAYSKCLPILRMFSGHAGLLDALHNETPPSEPAMSPTNKLHAAYEPISEAELLADGLIEPVSSLCSYHCHLVPRIILVITPAN